MRTGRTSANRRGPRGAERLLSAVGILALLMLPVEYRAGAERAHPHAAFQLWADFAHGAEPHRHDEHPGHAAHGVAHGVAHEPVLTHAVEARPDLPSVSEATPPAERAAAFASAVALLSLMVLARPPRIAGPVRRLVGRVLQPDFPPPRLLAV